MKIYKITEASEYIGVAERRKIRVKMSQMNL